MYFIEIHSEKISPSVVHNVDENNEEFLNYYKIFLR